ncbi:MAG: DUF1512 domain-containing protein [Nitrososphaerota archaeon]|nr:DUF1512 domain-containing protein [Nitrososphaerales archaeon]MDW8044435.1 DUF1512 domain-containing protein [Nitrososphaerota archaeon]
MLESLHLLTWPGENIFGDNPTLYFLLFYMPFILFLLYGQKFQTWMVLNEIGRSLNKLKMMKERSRKEAIDYFTNVCKTSYDPTERIDQFLEYFTIFPVDTDPSGIMKKIEHIITLRDDRLRSEVRKMITINDPVKMSAAENILEATTALNFIYKIVRHYYLLGKRTMSLYVLIQLQVLMPIILQEADALMKAIDAFKSAQPIGDGIGAMVAGKLMLNTEKRIIGKDTVMGESEFNGRFLYLIKAEGPAGNVGQIGTVVEKLIEEMGLRPNAIVMIDAALKLEGEKTGDIAEGIGAAIGGIGVDRFKIEEVATKYNIPLYAIVIKESIIDAITVMRKEIAEATDKVIGIIKRILDEKTKVGDKVFIIGVGNTLGIGQ